MSSSLLVDVAHPYNKVHGANMGPIWGRQDPGGSHVGPMNFAIWAVYQNLNVAIQNAFGESYLIRNSGIIKKNQWTQINRNQQLQRNTPRNSGA